MDTSISETNSNISYKSNQAIQDSVNKMKSQSNSSSETELPDANGNFKVVSETTQVNSTESQSNGRKVEETTTVEKTISEKQKAFKLDLLV